MSDTARRFTGKQQAFIDAYFACNWNGVEAARRAGYQGDDATLRVIASTNLTKSNIRSEIDRRLKQHKMGADEVLARLSFIASGSFEDFIDPDSLSIDLKKAKRAEKLGLIKKLKITTVVTSHADRDTQTETIEFELHDPMKALELLGKHHKVFDRAAESDWRKELEDAGYKPDALLETLTDEFTRHIRDGAKRTVR